MQHVLQTIWDNSDQISVELSRTVYEVVIPGVLRCVDDAKHTTVRALALKLTVRIFKSCQDSGIHVNIEIVKEVLLHVRDQVSTEGNQNLKSQGIEIVSLLEKHFVTS